jgi:pimeloyl-ACP methyl ester carboxylesterase
MAQRAKTKETVELNGASHVVMVSQPSAVAALIKKAAQYVNP